MIERHQPANSETVACVLCPGIDDAAESFGPQVANALSNELHRLLAGLARENHFTITRRGSSEWAVEFKPTQRAPDALTEMIQELSSPIDVGGIKLFAGPHAGLVCAGDGGRSQTVQTSRARAAARHARRIGAPVVRWDRALSTRQRHRSEILADFHHALSRDHLGLVYQPKCHLPTAKIAGAEALLRWSHPRLGQIPANDYIHLVEASALIRPLTTWALATASHAWASAPPALAAGRVAVNLPPASIVDHGFEELIVEAITDHDVDPNHIQIEITERGVGGPEPRLIRGLAFLADLGFTLALDDFGTGQSSLGLLRHLPTHEIKIDRAFVTGIENDPINRAIVEGCVAIGRSLGTTVCAEGIETEVEFTTVRDLGCEVGQGYLIGAPGDIHEWDRQIRQVTGLARNAEQPRVPRADGPPPAAESR